MELLEKYENMEQNGTSCYFDGFDISNLAEYYSTIDEMGKAQEVVRYGLSLHPNDPDIMIANGQLLVRQGKTFEARMIAEKLDLTNDRELLFLKGNIELADTNPSLADVYFRQASETDEEDTEFYSDVISLFIENCQYGLAQEWLDKALLIDPESKDLNEQQADLYFVTQDLDKAEESYNRLIDDFPYDAYYWEQLTCIAYRQQDYPKALECLEFLEAVDPFDCSLGTVKAECLINTGQYEKAERYLKEMRRKVPDSSEPLFILADALSMQGKHEESIDYINKAIGLDKEDPRLYLMLSCEQYECNLFKESAESMTTAFRFGGKAELDFMKSLLTQLLAWQDYESAFRMLDIFFLMGDDISSEEIGYLYPVMALVCWKAGHTESLPDFFKKAYGVNQESTLRLFGLEGTALSYQQVLNRLLNNPQNNK